MAVNAAFAGFLDSFVVTKTGGHEEIRVPSGRVRLVGGFEVAANQALRICCDGHLRKGLVDPPGQPGFLLKPAFRVIDVHELGKLGGTVALTTLNATGDPHRCLADDTNLDIGNAVYVFAGSNITPDDIDGVDPDPIAVIPVEPNSTGDYTYHTVITPGTYTIALTCQAGKDNPDDGQSEDIKFVAPVTQTISADKEVAVDFSKGRNRYAPKAPSPPGPYFFPRCRVMRVKQLDPSIAKPHRFRHHSKQTADRRDRDATVADRTPRK